MVVPRQVNDRVQGLRVDDFMVQPRNAAPMPTRNKVTVYFIGTRVLRDGKPPVVNVGQRVIQLPPIGESIVVEEHVAKDLETRLRWFISGDPSPIPGITESREIARAVKLAYDAAVAKGGKAEEINEAIMDLDVRKMVGDAVVRKADTASLVAELQARIASGEVDGDLETLLKASKLDSEKPKNKEKNKPGDATSLADLMPGGDAASKAEDK